MKARFIFNPHSGRNRRNPWLRQRAAEFIRQHGWDATVISTTHPRHATELARQAVEDGCELVVAIGGDGTMNEVATGLVGTPTAFGLIPCGSGNGLGRHLGIPGAGRGAFQTLLEGQPVPIDTGRVNRDPFFNAMGLGFEADVSVRFSRLTSRGLMGYIRTGFSAFFSHEPELVSILHDGGVTHLSAFTLAVMNSEQYGNEARIAPGASVVDGKFDLIAVPKVGISAACGLVVRLPLRNFDRSPHVTRLNSTHFVITRAKPGWIHTDGEPRAAGTRLEVTLLPGSLRVMVPRTRVPAPAPRVEEPAAVSASA